MKRHEVLETFIVFSLVCLIINVVFAANWAFWAALILLFLGLIENPVAYFISQIWMKIARGIGHVNSQIILALVFYLVLTPIAFLYRLFVKETRQYFNDKNTLTTFIDVTETYNKDLFERPW